MNTKDRQKIVEKVYNKNYANKVFITKNPNRKNKSDQYNVRVLELTNVLELQDETITLTEQKITEQMKDFRHLDEINDIVYDAIRVTKKKTKDEIIRKIDNRARVLTQEDRIGNFAKLDELSLLKQSVKEDENLL